MGPEDLPSARSETLQNGLSLQGAKGGIGIDGGHQHRGVLVVFGLFPGLSVQIDVDVSGEHDIVGVVDQHRFAGKVSAPALIDLEVHFSAIEEACLNQRFRLFAGDIPHRFHLVWFGRTIEGQCLADVDVWPVERVLLTVAILAIVFQREAEF